MEQLKQKMYNDSVAHALELQRLELENTARIQEELEKAKEQEEEAKRKKLAAQAKARLEWLVREGTVTNAPVFDKPWGQEARVTRIEPNGTFRMTLNGQMAGIQRLVPTDFFTGNLKDLDPSTVRIDDIDENYFGILVNCVAKGCVEQENKDFTHSLDVAYFGPYSKRRNTNFEQKLSQAFKDVINNLSGYSSPY